MGKQLKKYSVKSIAPNDSKISKSRRVFSETSLDQSITKKQKKIRKNFRNMIRRLMAKQVHNKQNYAVSFLNIMASCEDICSLVCVPGIPSIQNMMSHHLINSYQQDNVSEDQSRNSVTEPISSKILKQQPEIPIHFVCLLEKVFKLISCPLTKKQNQSVVKGTWNIFIKYWKDTEYTLYKVSEKVEWGLLQLLNFKFHQGKKQRFQAEQKLRMSLNEIQNPHQQQNRSQSHYFCTLQLIQ